MTEVVRLLQELNTENDRLTSQLTEAKMLLKLAIDAVNHGYRTCNSCTHYLFRGCDIGKSPYGAGEMECEWKWRYADKALKLIGDDEVEEGWS